MRLPLILLTSLTATFPANADPKLLAETPLGSDRCPAIATTKTGEDGTPLKRSEWYASAWRCKGYRGRYAYIAYGDQREMLAFGTRRSRTTKYVQPLGFGAWGPMLEWRGSATANTPLAAIARYSWNIAAPTSEPANKGAMLAVVRVGRGANDSCLVAWVDAVANIDALDLARKHADTRVGSHICQEGQEPLRLGKVGER